MNLRRTWGTVFLLLAGACQLPAQIVDGFSPSVGPVGVTIDFFGTGFGPSNKFYFNGKRGTNFFFDNSTHVTVKVANGTPLGTGPIGIQNDTGPTNFSFGNFTVIGAGPYITNVFPTTSSGGDFFRIDGVQFIFNGFNANVTSIQVNGANVAGFFIENENRIWVTNQANVTTGFI